MVDVLGPKVLQLTEVASLRMLAEAFVSLPAGLLKPLTEQSDEAVHKELELSRVILLIPAPLLNASNAAPLNRVGFKVEPLIPLVDGIKVED